MEGAFSVVPQINSVCIHGQVPVFFIFLATQYCNCHRISDLVMISSLTLEPLTCTDTHLKRITHVRVAPIGSYCFLLLPCSECFSERKNKKLFMKTLCLFLALELSRGHLCT